MSCGVINQIFQFVLEALGNCWDSLHLHGFAATLYHRVCVDPGITVFSGSAPVHFHGIWPTLV